MNPNVSNCIKLTYCWTTSSQILTKSCPSTRAAVLTKCELVPYQWASLWWVASQFVGVEPKEREWGKEWDRFPVHTRIIGMQPFLHSCLPSTCSDTPPFFPPCAPARNLQGLAMVSLFPIQSEPLPTEVYLEAALVPGAVTFVPFPQDKSPLPQWVIKTVPVLLLVLVWVK